MADILQSLPISCVRTIKFEDAPLGALLGATLLDVRVAGIKARLRYGIPEWQDHIEGVLILSSAHIGKFCSANDITGGVVLDLREVAEIQAELLGATKVQVSELALGDLVCDSSNPDILYISSQFAEGSTTPGATMRQFICVRGNDKVPSGQPVPSSSISPIKIAQRIAVIPKRAPGDRKD